MATWNKTKPPPWNVFFKKFCVHLQSNIIYLEHPAFVDVSPLDMSFPTRHLGQHLHCWNMLEQISLSKQIPMIFHFGPLICRICPHRLGVLPSRRRVSPLLRPAPWPWVEISSKDPESSRFMKFSPTTVWILRNMSLLFCAHFFYSNWILFINSISAFIWCHSASQEVETTLQNPSKTGANGSISRYSELLQDWALKMLGMELHSYLSMVDWMWFTTLMSNPTIWIASLIYHLGGRTPNLSSLVPGTNISHLTKRFWEGVC